MASERGIAGKIDWRHGFGLFVLAALALSAAAQNVVGPAKERTLSSHFPSKPSLPPAYSISTDPLGFSSPGPIYLGSRNTLASLDFLDEDRLLFTFRVPGLLHRDPSGSDAGGERRIRAVVLALPGGTVQAQDTWTVHDRVRYLWMLQGGRFLLRDRNSLFEGGASLAMKSLFDFPGSLLDVEFDPGQQLLVTNSHEPVAKQKNASASAEADEAASADGDLVVRILRRTTGQLLLVSRARSAVHLSINSEGYLEGLRGQGMNWMLNLDYFTGGSRMLGGVESTCMPDDNFITDNLILAIGCGPYGESWLTAMTTAGRRLWKAQTPSTAVWPQLTVGLNGQRLALATLDISHSIDSFAPIGAEDVKEQSVTVFDSATGDIALVSPLSPILDAGGNVAISPSGRRVALLNAGAIQIFELGAPPALPAASAHER